MFITFEGIDGSGKTTLSQLVAQKVNIAIEPSPNFVWTKEPTFSSEQADHLNLKGMDSAHREVEFLVDRITHQDCLRGVGMYEPVAGPRNVVCDRYIWSGLAYSKVFNPSVFDFVSVLYSHKYFIKPDLYVFVDTPPEVCCQRRRVPAQMTNLINLRQAFLDTEKDIIHNSAVYTINGDEDLDKLTDELVDLIKGNDWKKQ